MRLLPCDSAAIYQQQSTSFELCSQRTTQAQLTEYVGCSTLTGAICPDHMYALAGHTGPEDSVVFTALCDGEGMGGMGGGYIMIVDQWHSIRFYWKLQIGANRFGLKSLLREWI